VKSRLRKANASMVSSIWLAPLTEVRCHKASAGSKATFHSLDTRRGEEGGAVFQTGEALGWFDY
jgi:hypothetical protein